MRVGPVSVSVRDGIVERSAPVDWTGGDAILWVRGGAEVMDPTGDVTGFAAVALPVAMRLGEELWIEGPVSPLFADRGIEAVRAIYEAWDPRARSVKVHATPSASGVASGVPACVFSRGVDSLYTAVRDRIGDRRFGALLFIDGLEPRHGEEVRAGELLHARHLADQLRMPLITASTNVRSFTDSLGWDWADILAAGLSCVAHNVAGAIESLCIASADDYATLGPNGSHPLLDRHYSSERVAIEHDTVATSRTEKVRCIVEQRPELLGGLKVCFAEDRTDNCGRCSKCLLTMVLLHHCGALAAATGFPDAIDPDAIRRLRLPHLPARIQWSTAGRALGTTGEDDRLRVAIAEMLAASALTRPTTNGGHAGPWQAAHQMRDHHLNRTLSLVVDGVAYEPMDDPPAGDREAERPSLPL